MIDFGGGVGGSVSVAHIKINYNCICVLIHQFFSVSNTLRGLWRWGGGRVFFYKDLSVFLGYIFLVKIIITRRRGIASVNDIW